MAMLPVADDEQQSGFWNSLRKLNELFDLPGALFNGLIEDNRIIGLRKDEMRIMLLEEFSFY